MAKPLVIMVGADKGGVGKTTLARALDDYLQVHKAVRKVYDGQFPKGDLKQFCEFSEVANLLDIDTQMEVFDKLRGVTLLDIAAGEFGQVLAKMDRVGLLTACRNGNFNLMLLHVLGPSAASLDEIASIAHTLGNGALHVLVKNYINEAGFKEWDDDPRFAAMLAKSQCMKVPHLEGRAANEVQKLGLSFAKYAADKNNQSFVLTGYVRSWEEEVYAALDNTGLGRLIEETREV